MPQIAVLHAWAVSPADHTQQLLDFSPLSTPSLPSSLPFFLSDRSCSSATGKGTGSPAPGTRSLRRNRNRNWRNRDRSKHKSRKPPAAAAVQYWREQKQRQGERLRCLRKRLAGIHGMGRSPLFLPSPRAPLRGVRLGKSTLRRQRQRRRCNSGAEKEARTAQQEARAARTAARLISPAVASSPRIAQQQWTGEKAWKPQGVVGEVMASKSSPHALAHRSLFFCFFLEVLPAACDRWLQEGRARGASQRGNER